MVKRIHLINMKRLTLILLLFIPLSLFATKYYLAPAGDDVSGAGTIGSPWFTLEKAWAAVSAGDTIYMRDGTYEYTTRQDLNGKDGTSGNRINIWAYPDETPIITADVTFNKATQGQLILMDADYIHARGLEITGFVQDEGVYAYSAFQVDQTNYSIFERLDYHGNGMSMIIQGSSTGNLILNCDFYENYSIWGRTPYDGSSRPYEDADGLAFRGVDYESDNTIRGCRFWNNGDDGVDLWDNDGHVLIDGCWAWGNGYREDGETTGGDGAGIKLGETSADYSDEYLRTVQNCLTMNNRQFGISQNGALCMAYVYNNTVYGNLYRGIYFSSVWGTVREHIFRNNIAYANTTNTVITADATVDHNSWQDGLTISTDDFVSVWPVGIDGARQTDGSLPEINFMHLETGSDLIGAGIVISGLEEDCAGYAWKNPPSIGAFEYGSYVLEEGTHLGTGTGNNLMVDKNGRIIIIQ